MTDTATLGEVVNSACLDCIAPPGRLCEHDQQLLPLATAIARGFGATEENPRAGIFLTDADWIYNTVGPGPYDITELDVDAVPDIAPLNGSPYCAALLINRWVIAFGPEDNPGESELVVVCRIPETANH